MSFYYHLKQNKFYLDLAYCQIRGIWYIIVWKIQICIIIFHVRAQNCKSLSWCLHVDHNDRSLCRVLYLRKYPGTLLAALYVSIQIIFITTDQSYNACMILSKHRKEVLVRDFQFIVFYFYSLQQFYMPYQVKNHIIIFSFKRSQVSLTFFHQVHIFLERGPVNWKGSNK